MKLEYEFTYRTAVIGPRIVGDGPFGTRHLYDMTDGVIEGSRLRARSAGAAADWMLIGGAGFMRMDVRLQLVTDDGAVLLAHYRGPAEANHRLRAAIEAGAATGYDDQCIRAVWRIESGDARYAWVNRTVFVGEGRVCPTDAGVPGFEQCVYRAA